MYMGKLGQPRNRSDERVGGQLRADGVAILVGRHGNRSAECEHIDASRVSWASGHRAPAPGTKRPIDSPTGSPPIAIVTPRSNVRTTRPRTCRPA